MVAIWADIRKFVSAIIANVGAMMSGAASVPFTILSVWTDPIWAKTILGALAVMALLGAVFIVWRQEYKKSKDLAEQLRPKLKCSFDDKIPGCAVLVHDGPSTQIGYFRLRIETDKSPIARECRAKLIFIKSLKDVLSNNETVWLAFDAKKGPVVSVNDGAPEFIDIAAAENGRLVIAAPLPFSVDHTKIGRTGKHLFQVVVSSEDGLSEKLDLLINWTGEFKTSTISCRPSVLNS